MTEISEQEFLHYYADIQRKASDQRAESGDMSALKKRAKEAGIDVPILVLAARFAKLDPIEYIAQLNRLITYLGFLRLKGAGQLALIQQIDPEQPPSLQDHFDEGFAAAINGQGPETCDLDITKKAGKKWMEGHDLGRSMLNGTANVVSMKPKLVEPVEAELPSDVEPTPDPWYEPLATLEEDNPAPEDTPAFLTEKPKKARKGKAKKEEEPAPEEDEGVVAGSDLVSRLMARVKT